MVLPYDAYQNKTKIIIIVHNDWKKHSSYCIIWKKKKQDILWKKKLDTDFKNSLGCAVVAYEKQWSQKLYDFGRYCEFAIQFIFLYES